MKNTVDSIELNSGEYLALHTYEIVSIPDSSVLIDDLIKDIDIEEEYKKAFGSLATEIYQSYEIYKKDYSDIEVAAEILWLTEPVEKQAYNAKIRIFFIVRAVAGLKNVATEYVERISASAASFFKLQKYGFVDYNFSEIKKIINAVEQDNTAAIVKDERSENLQNQILPYCYTYDIFKSYARDMASFVNSLIEHPRILVSIQILPTKFQNYEESSVIQMAQSLNTLNRGIMSPGIGNISVSSVERSSNTYNYYQDNKNSALLNYNIIISGKRSAVDDISSKLQGYINYDSNYPVALKKININENIGIFDNYYSFPWLANDVIMKKERKNEIWNRNLGFEYFFRLPYVITTEEASGLFRIPVGNKRIQAGLPISDIDSSNKNYGENLVNSGDIEIGSLKSVGSDTIGISLNDIAKHMLVVGTPGSGKTTFSVGLLDRLWKEHHIPFLVIEPAKNEYRSLVQSIPELQIFTPGKNFISPFLFNPFVPPKNVKLETYKSTLKTAFAAGVSMSSPLDKIFEEAISNCYSDFRWLDYYTIDDAGKVFNIDDFIKCFKETFDSIGYTGDARNIGRAGVVRLKSLVNLFDNYNTIPISDLLSKPTIIELAAIENSDQKSLIISLILLSILSYVNTNYVGEGGLKNVILLEEAHVLLDTNSGDQRQDADPSAIAKGLLKRMLAEIRSYGVGIIIADQSPRKVTTDVVALTDIKMAFRLVEAVDRQIISDSMNMSEAQEKRLSRLKPGEAFLFFSRLDDSEEVKTPDYRLEKNISISLSDNSIKELSMYWRDKKEKLRPYPECKLISCCSKECNYERRVLAKEIARRIFVKFFKSETNDLERLKYVFARITKLVKYELNNEPFSQELLICVKVHLWRKIKYETKIKIKNEQIENSLRKYNSHIEEK